VISVGDGLLGTHDLNTVSIPGLREYVPVPFYVPPDSHLSPVWPWKNYAYLGLYNLAYMADDSLMVGIAVSTLSRKRLQEKEGRWLKLVSGVVIALLGVLLLFRPEWLV
jgi:hypothetical protein